MLFDRFTFLAQIVNFLILAWLLRRFLFKPVMQAVEARESRLAKEREEAAIKKAEAITEKNRWEKETAEWEKRRDDMNKKAAAEIESAKSGMLERARKETEAQRESWRASFEKDKSDLRAETAERVRKEVFAMVTDTLRNLADTQLERAALTVFSRKLRELSDGEREILLRNSHDPGTPLLLRTALELSPESQANLTRTLREVLGAQGPIRFEIDPALLWGIELSGPENTLSWNAAAAVSALELKANEAFAATEENHASG